MVEVLSQTWQAKLADLIASSDTSLFIAAPFIKHAAAQWVLDSLKGQGPQRTTVVTDISADSVLGGSLDLNALLLFSDSLRKLAIFDVRRLHAKVYVADEKQAIITSGNLTSAAFARNYEYGVVLTEPLMVRQVTRDMERYTNAGRQVSRKELANLEEVSLDLRRQYQRASGQVEAEARRGLARAWDEIAGNIGVPKGLYETGSARFKDPIVESLSSHEPLTTAQLCRVIQEAWPYLCDDTILRIAKDGSRKRQWRHDIHTAQETLQRNNVIRRDERGLWHIRR